MFGVLDLEKFKKEGRKLTMVTAYDATYAKLIAQSTIDTVLVGDSVAMVVHGYESTLHATPEMMVLHTAAVARGLSATGVGKFLVGDMPFLSTRRGVGPALECAGALMRAGAHAVKIEGAQGHEDVIRTLITAGIPVMGHLGLTPQSVNTLGGYRVQGRTPTEGEKVFRDADLLQEWGCCALVLECVPEALARQISLELKIPTIGIGAGVGTDGQVLVLHDLLGLTSGHKPRFVRNFAEGARTPLEALEAFAHAVRERQFPSAQESYP